MKIKGDRITVKLIAGEDLVEGDSVYLSGANTVSKATDGVTAKKIGAADEAATSGDMVSVVLVGIKQMVADGAISAGDRVIAAATSGRVQAENSATTTGHTHTENTAASYTQNATTLSATDTVETSRVIGIALGAASAAGDIINVLVGVN